MMEKHVANTTVLSLYLNVKEINSFDLMTVSS